MTANENANPPRSWFQRATIYAVLLIDGAIEVLLILLMLQGALWVNVAYPVTWSALAAAVVFILGLVAVFAWPVMCLYWWEERWKYASSNRPS